MLKMVETFSGIGAQAKALANIKRDFNYDYEILNTADWDINAIIAYDLIHNKEKKVLDKYEKMSKEELLNNVSKHTLSTDGKKQASFSVISKLNVDVLKRLCTAIERTNNLISVTDIKGETLPEETNILTYSFPCQDLSVAGSWHGNKGGIDRNANNRSSMLWQIERILQERKSSSKKMPRFLLMENVRNITSKEHIKNFDEWKDSLNKIGYINFPLALNSEKFGIPQKRCRVYMISFFVGKNKKLQKRIQEYMKQNDLEKVSLPKRDIKEFLRLDYNNMKYKFEADFSQPNNTPSRIKIGKDNLEIYDGKNYKTDIVPTITTKQDRHPNSGIIRYPKKRGKCDFRYLTPRECFLLMGFTEEDYDIIMDNNFYSKKNTRFFNENKLIKMAGNSIVVNVLEEIFKLLNNINRDIYEEQ